MFPTPPTSLFLENNCLNSVFRLYCIFLALFPIFGPFLSSVPFQLRSPSLSKKFLPAFCRFRSPNKGSRTVRFFFFPRKICGVYWCFISFFALWISTKVLIALLITFRISQYHSLASFFLHFYDYLLRDLHNLTMSPRFDDFSYKNSGVGNSSIMNTSEP